VSEPLIADPVKLREYVASEKAAKRIVLAETEDETQLTDIVCGGGGIALAIGPEGGWSEEELQLFESSGWSRASLGETILRAETAAIAATVVALSENK
jgi:16S rRNA (uracil1498-N3)-methyltransferase